MTKRQLIDEILDINRTANPAFLADFNEADLAAYLRHLCRGRQPRGNTIYASGEYVSDAALAVAEAPAQAAEPADDPLSSMIAELQQELTGRQVAREARDGHVVASGHRDKLRRAINRLEELESDQAAWRF